MGQEQPHQLVNTRQILPENGIYQLNPTSWAWRVWPVVNETHSLEEGWVKTVQTERGLHQRFEVAFNFILHNYVEIKDS
jgi:hypothetical protein